MSFAYTLSTTKPNTIQTTTLTGGGSTTKFELFDGLGRAVQTQTPAEGGGTVVKTSGYDDQGRVYWVDGDYWTTSVSPSVSLFVPDSPTAIPSQTITSFDAIGRTTKTVLRSTGTQRFQTAMSYLGADRVDTVPPAGGTPTSMFTNTLGQQTKLTQYLSASIGGTSQATTYAYDGAGRRTSMIDPAGNAWTWAYDVLGHRITQSDPDSGVSTATYDNLGNLLSTTDARGQTVTTTYDSLNRKTASYSGSASGAMLASWTYDTVKKGLLTKSTAYTGSTPGTPGLAYSKTIGGYDDLGNVLESTVSVPAGAPAFAGTSYKTTLTYNVDSTVATRSVPAAGGLPSELIRYTYNSWGRMLTLRGSTAVLNGTIYSPIGQLAQFNRSNGTNQGYSTYGYDVATSAVLSITDNAVFGGSGHYVADRAHTRDDAGNVTSSTVDSMLPTAGSQKTCYSYDALRELTRAWTPAKSVACSVAPTTAGLAGIAPYWVDYGYDTTSGNRVSVTSRSASGAVKSATLVYPVASGARPHGVTAVTGDAALGAGSYGYDSAGNTTTRPGQTVTYNEAGKVATVTVTVTAGSVSQSHVYDADGSLLLRVSTAEGASLFLGDTVLSEAAGSSVVAGSRTYAGAQGVPVAQRTAKTGTVGTTLLWLFTDLHGTVDTQTVASTGVTSRQYRDPFGAPIGGASGVWPDGSGFLSKPVTASTGLTTVGARTYDPLMGKFISVDPVIDPDNPQQNIGYGYSGNNPTTFSDPTGLFFGGAGCGLRCVTPSAGTKTPAAAQPQTRSGSRTPKGCAYGSSGCRGVSDANASDGVRRGQVDICRAFDSTRCELGDYRVLPILPVQAGLATGADVMTSNHFARWVRNAPVTVVALSSAVLVGGKCGYSGSHGVFVCVGSPIAQRGGTTVGDAFLLNSDDERDLLIALDDSKESEALLSHEERHASQWGALGPVGFVSSYLVESAKSVVLTSDPGCANWFEHDAGPFEGHYSAGCAAR
jgi:RHS repeat-associated protein